MDVVDNKDMIVAFMCMYAKRKNLRGLVFGSAKTKTNSIINAGASGSAVSMSVPRADPLSWINFY